ncbi:MAG TPA: hypothetical protein VFK57_21115 [Vicinamibacterales bacterium]|nr:hypothetical protein [Vicinamibacterales bacterium]
MNIDRYTKCVLTVIAACLLWMCVMGAGSPLAAQSGTRLFPHADVQPVILVGTGTLDQAGTVTVNFVSRRGQIPATDPTLPVTLPTPLLATLPYSPGAPLPVEIASVKKTGDWEPLRASVEDAPTRRQPGNGKQ